MRRDLLALAVESVMGTGVMQQNRDWIELRSSYIKALSWLGSPVLCVPNVPSIAGFCDRIGGRVGRIRVVKIRM